MKIFETIMRNLGFLAISEHDSEMERFRLECEEFAKDYLDASNGATLGSESANVSGAEFKYHNVIIGSNIKLDGCKFKSLAVAPWCKKVWINNAQVDTSPQKRQRAVVRVSSEKWDAATHGKFVMGAK